MSKNNVLVFNCGSSSIKFTVLSSKTGDSEVYGVVEALNTGSPFISLTHKKTKLLNKEMLSVDDYEYSMREIIGRLHQIPGCVESIKAIGHRVVHGGESFNNAIIINNKVLETIKECIELAPLHNPANLQGIKVAQQEFPNLKHIACFDTAFHQSMPPKSYIYPLPYDWYKEYKVRRYGFHGMSHKFVSNEAASFLNQNISHSKYITAHLGNGCSAAAVLNGRSVDTTMGMTPLEGLMMGTRSGNVDPSIIFFMSEKLEVPPHDIHRMLNNSSGLLGVSELSMDMRVLEERAQLGNKQAEFAIELYCYILAKQIASLCIAITSLDALIFTGGIGENSVLIRSKTVDYLGILNLRLDAVKNKNLIKGLKGNIAADNSLPILVIPTNEEFMIAKEVEYLI